jgi:hypothetical protein
LEHCSTISRQPCGEWNLAYVEAASDTLDIRASSIALFAAKMS